jgi:hypothetical protein
MEILKSSLKQVPENERVKGRVYGVADGLDGELGLMVFYDHAGKDSCGVYWKYWFELPESMLPTVMPEVGKEYEFSDDGVDWHSCKFKGFNGDGGTWNHIRPIQLNPAQTLSIPAGTKAEQVEFLRGVIATFEGGGV